MDHRKLLSAAIFATAAVLAAPAFANGADLVTNGGFETGDFSGWSVAIDTDYSGIDGLAAHGGSFGAYFGDFGTPGSISQSFATVAGTSYDIRLWVRNDGMAPNSLDVLWGGLLVYSASNLGAFPFTEIVIGHQATSALTTLELRARNDGGFLELDDISVSAVPEPSSLAALVSGLLLLGTVLKRRGQA